MEAGAQDPPPEPQPPSGPPAKWNPGSRPNLTVPQLLAFVAFGLYAALTLLASDDGRVTTSELDQMGTLTMFLIGALLPSDALIRYGRNLLFRKVEDAEKAARYAPATTLAQLLAFGTFLIVMTLTLLGGVSATEFRDVNEVARVLIVALIPSDAGIRFGRAMYFRATVADPRPGQLRRM